MSPSDITNPLGSRKPPGWKPVSVLVGGVMVHLTLGTVYTFGNLNPYLTSYMRKSGSAPDLTYTKCSWIFATALMGQGLSMFVGGVVDRKLGPRLTTIIGSWVMSLGVLLTYFSIQHSFALVVLTYGLTFGFGVGFAYAIPLSCAIKWFPQRKGLVSGIIVAGFGGGAFVFNMVQTTYVNPNNIKTETVTGHENYFQDEALLEKVPSTFLLLGGCYAAMQFIGSMLLCHPPNVEQESSNGYEFSEKVPIVDEIKLPSVGKESQGFRDNNCDLPPSQILQTKSFYLIWLMFCLTSQANLFISTLYKAYGQTFIANDKFLSLVGTFASLFNGLGRIFWGTVADRYSVKAACVAVNSLLTCLMLTLQVTSLAGKFLFMIYMCLALGCASGCYSIFPTATAKCYGRKYMAMNYGLVFSNQIVTSFIGVFMSQLLMTSIGWTGLFFVVSACTFCSLLLTFAFNAKDKNGEDV